MLRDPVSSQYSDGLDRIPPETSHHATGLHDQLGTLPFTGIDLIALVAISVFLVSFGLVLARTTKTRRVG